jgi:hypothetical protein
MGQGAFLDPMKLGPPGDELEFKLADDTQLTQAFGERFGRVAVKLDTVSGEGRQVVHQQYDPSFRIVVQGGSHIARDAIRALRAIADVQLGFVYADDWRIPSERYVMETATTFTMRDTPYTRLDKAYDDAALPATLGNFGVYTDRKFINNHATSNEFVSYDRQTRLVTTNPKTPGDIVFMDYTFKGCTVRFSTHPNAKTIKAFKLGTRAWAISLALEAV